MELPAGGASRDQVRAAYSGHDALIALSEPLKDYLVESLGIEPGRVHVVPWGAELAFYGEREPVPERRRPLVVSAGKTDRDYATLASAARGLEADFRIFADLQSVDGLEFESPQIEVLAAQPGRFSVPFSEFVPALRQATVVAIPTRDAPHMPGQTSLFEAMAVGRPVVMTRTRYLPFDIEQEGIGLWVAPADVEGWSKALRFLLERRAEAEAMGARARRLAETYFNIHRYARDVAAILRGVAGR
jgi:glycosyltransferase involved in cell wall biosynthesis